MSKLANPLQSPLSMLVAGGVLVVGIRVLTLPAVVVVPVAVGIAVAGATLRQRYQAPTVTLDNPELEAEVRMVQRQAKAVAERAAELRQEAQHRLTDSTQLELLASVQVACDRVAELPAKVADLAQRMQGRSSLLDVKDLQRQLVDVEAKLRQSRGAAVRQQLQQLAESLQCNIELAQAGQDARQVQVASLSTLILDSVGVLQTMHNCLQSFHLADVQGSSDLQALSQELRIFQENVDLLVGR